MTRTSTLIAIFLVLAASSVSAQNVGVSQLEQILSQAKSEQDGELATKLSRLNLTERFGSARLEHWTANLPGIRSQRALMGLADRSAFLNPPQDEISAIAKPDLAEQKHIMGLAAVYVSKAIPQLPRFFALRTTSHFEDSADAVRTGPWEETETLRPVRISRAVVLYRDGEEVLQPGLIKTGAAPASDKGLRTWGTFGPILGLVLVDAAENAMEWERWEKAAAGPVAVFRYAVPKARSHYEVRYCCVATRFGMENHFFAEMSAYHGEITVDPATGVIQRLTIEAEPNRGDPVSRAALAVEYGPVELGGTTYTCPVRSVSISLAETQRSLRDPGGNPWTAMGPPQMLLNHVDFSQYHLFRSESRVLTPEEERAVGLAPDATLPTTEPTDLLPAEEDIAEAPAAKPASATQPSGSAQSAESHENGAENQEITTAAATGLPDISPHPVAETASDTPVPSGLTLRVNTRLVDVNVVALDKKDRPITGLKPEDFEVYDNGVKQDVRSFMQTTAEASPETPVQSPSVKSAEFSNHSPKNDAHAEENTTILLIDASNLDFGDLTDARQQMLRFLESLPPNERVALYLMKYHGFQVLREASTDHAALAAQLSKWRPSVQDVANAQDQEKRNRQQIETVHDPEDLLNVNGNYTMDSSTQSEALDPKLRELGSRPGPNALNILVDVAHHLSAVPGHKNLIWVTSDNALADWNKLSYNMEKGSKYIEPIALRAQEAMNNAHVSVYPLDASRLEASVVTAETGRRNVELTPVFERPALLEHELEGPEATAGQDMNPYVQNRQFGNGSRLQAAMEQDVHSVQGVFREVADATGGRVFRRSGNILGELNEVIADGHATYLLGFSPSEQADGQYHRLTVKLVGHHDATLRFRSGYQYDREPATLKERFAQTVWQPADASEIAVSTKLVSDAEGNALRVTVAGSDLSLQQQNSVWAGKLDIFVVQRDPEALHAKVSGMTVGLHLKSATYEHAIKDGLTFDQRLDAKRLNGSLRVVVVDVNTGRIGSVTVPSAALETSAD